MKKGLHGNLTIEAAVIVPLILTIFALIVTLLFYYHDKNVVAGIAHETVVLGCGEAEITAEELEQYFQKRIRRKLLVFSYVYPEVTVDEEEITMTCEAWKKGMSLRIEASMNKTEPEKFIRNLRRLEKIGEELGEAK